MDGERYQERSSDSGRQTVRLQTESRGVPDIRLNAVAACPGVGHLPRGKEQAERASTGKQSRKQCC